MEPPSKRRRLSPPTNTLPSTDTTTAPPLVNTSFANRASKWNLEQDYERRPRKKKQEIGNTRLPIKTAEGRLEPAQTPAAQESEAETSDALDEDTPDTGFSAEEGGSEKLEVPVRQQILEAKEELARIAGLMSEDPEEHVGALKTMGHITSSKISTITKLGLATQLTVYKDIIPGYRIRPLSEEDMKAKLSREVRKQRGYEQSIVRGYQKYVQDLERIAALRRPDASEEAAGMATVAMSCVCTLVTTVPHFNFRAELLRILVNKLAQKQSNPDFAPSCEAMRKLFENDDEGNASLEAVAMLAKMMRVKDYNVDEQALDLFLHLRLLSEFISKASTTKVDKASEASDYLDNKQKRKKEFRTKRERKAMKEQKGVEKEMQEADAQVSFEQRDKNQAETLKVVFGVCFRILKARTPHLMGPVLESLVKYAHLINQDFFGDLLESLKELIDDAIGSNLDADADAEDASDESVTVRQTTRESLLCVTTAFALLQGQDAAAAANTLSLDLSFFITHLYRTLLPISVNADLELSSRSARLADPHNSSASVLQRTKVNIQTTVVLLLRSLQAVLLPLNTRSIPPSRLAAFTKQILTSSLHTPEKSAQALLGLLNAVAKTHKRKIAALWSTEERKGDGVYDPLSGSVESSNPFASNVWEGELLRLHYAPPVREGVRNLERAVMDQ